MPFSTESSCKKFWAPASAHTGITRSFLDGFLMESVKAISCWYLVRLSFLKLEVTTTNKNLHLQNRCSIVLKWDCTSGANSSYKIILRSFISVPKFDTSCCCICLTSGLSSSAYSRIASCVSVLKKKN